jgi:uncharacterized coiled-coil protein SlyX
MSEKNQTPLQFLNSINENYRLKSRGELNKLNTVRNSLNKKKEKDENDNRNLDIINTIIENTKNECFKLNDIDFNNDIEKLYNIEPCVDMFGMKPFNELNESEKSIYMNKDINTEEIYNSTYEKNIEFYNKLKPYNIPKSFSVKNLKTKKPPATNETPPSSANGIPPSTPPETPPIPTTETPPPAKNKKPSDTKAVGFFSNLFKKSPKTPCEDSLKALQESNTALAKEKDIYKSLNELNSAKVYGLEDQFNKALVEGERLLTYVTKVNTDNQTLKDEVKSCNAENRTVSLEKTQLQKTNTVLSGELSTCDSEKKGLSDANTALSGQLSTCDSEKKGLSDANTALSGQLSTCETAKKGFEATIGVLQLEKSSLTNQLQVCESGNNPQIDTLNDQIAEKQTQIAEKQTQIERLTTEIKNLNETNAQKDIVLEKVKTELEKAKKPTLTQNIKSGLGKIKSGISSLPDAVKETNFEKYFPYFIYFSVFIIVVFSIIGLIYIFKSYTNTSSELEKEIEKNQKILKNLIVN